MAQIITSVCTGSPRQRPDWQQARHDKRWLDLASRLAVVLPTILTPTHLNHHLTSLRNDRDPLHNILRARKHMQPWRIQSNHSSTSTDKAMRIAFQSRAAQFAAAATSPAPICSTTRARLLGWREMCRPRHGWARYAISSQTVRPTLVMFSAIKSCDLNARSLTQK